MSLPSMMITLFVLRVEFACLFGASRSLRMARAVHCATGTTATAARFAFFLVADHFGDDQRAYEDERKRDEDGCKILYDKVEYDHSVHLFFRLLDFFRELGRFLVGAQ